MRAGVACLLLALVALMLACGGKEEGTPPPIDPPTPEPSEAPTPTSNAQNPAPTSYLTPEVIPGPAIYIDPAFGYSYEVPADWFVSRSVGGYSALTSYDPRTAPGHGFGCDEQSGVIKIEFYVEEPAGNPTLEEWLAQREPGSVSVLQETQTALDGIVGIRQVRSFGADTVADSDQYYFKVGSRIHAIIAYCFDPSLGILAVVLPTVKFNGPTGSDARYSEAE